MPSDAQLRKLLKAKFGHDAFRPGQVSSGLAVCDASLMRTLTALLYVQLETIKAVLRGEPALAVLPTGSGKSLCYQMPALLIPGTGAPYSRSRLAAAAAAYNAVVRSARRLAVGVTDG